MWFISLLFFPKAGAKIRQKTLYAFDAFDAKLLPN
jgi:hypothetical protein